MLFRSLRFLIEALPMNSPHFSDAVICRTETLKLTTYPSRSPPGYPRGATLAELFIGRKSAMENAAVSDGDRPRVSAERELQQGSLRGADHEQFVIFS